MPVPTSQFRSYRKVPGGSNGIQIGTASTASTDHGAAESLTASNLSLASTGPPIIQLQPPPPLTPTPIIVEPLPSEPSTPVLSDELLNCAKKNKRISPHNYIHASNPNLVEFDFQTVKGMLQTTWDNNPASHGNLHPMITLKDLMLQKQAEEAQDMYNKRVCLGVERQEDRNNLKKNLTKTTETKPENHTVNVPESVNKIQKRRLPVTPDYAQSFKLDDEDIMYTRSKEGQKLRDFGYELISGDEPFGAVLGSGPSGSGTNVANHEVKRSEGGSIKKKTRNWISNDRRNEESSSSDRSLRDSFKKSKNKAVIAKLDNIKASSEKLFQFKHSSNNDKESLKTKQTDKTTPALNAALSKSHPQTPLFAGEPTFFSSTTTTTTTAQIATSSTGFVPGGIKKSNTCNSSSDFKENSSKVPNARKNSAPERSASYFTKLSFSGGSSGRTAKEKKLLGSPGLHRAFFGKNQQPTVIDHEVFSPITYTKQSNLPTEGVVSNATMTSTIQIGGLQSTMTTTSSTITSGGGSSSSSVLTSSNLSNRGTSPDYPNMEYPPVFEAETYSLSDPGMTLLKRRQNHTNPK